MLQRYSEPYSATGGLAAEGVINQLGRPNIEPLEVLVREAVQNCWDAKRESVAEIRVEIGRRVLDAAAAGVCQRQLLVDPPPGLPLGTELGAGLEVLYFADFGTNGLGGPTRADQLGADRDFVDFIRNIGQPPDKELGGGSFGYGKAAFYIASRARTILVDTLCHNMEGALERRFIGCALGEGFERDGQPYTGRHWWGRTINGVPEPVVGAEAETAASLLGLPERHGETGLGTTVVIVAPGIAPEVEGDEDETTAFIARALTWNFWPRMIDTAGGAKRTMRFVVRDGDREVRLPDPRTHPRLRFFVEAMDRLREEPGKDDDFLVDRSIDCLRPVQRLGRLVLQRFPVSTASLSGGAVPQGERDMADTVHHVALMRTPELIVRYLPGPVSLASRQGYAGVFRCAVDVDEAFRRAEPPTHDDWVVRALPSGRERTFVKVALERVGRVCREVAGYGSVAGASPSGEGIPLGEFADSLAALMPGTTGFGARREAPTPRPRGRRARGRSRGGTPPVVSEPEWIDGDSGTPSPAPDDGPPGVTDAGGVDPGESSSVPPSTGEEGVVRPRRLPSPQLRTRADPSPQVAEDGSPVMHYPFELRTRGNRVRLTASVEVMANDGGKVETEAPVGSPVPVVRAWIDPGSHRYETSAPEVGPDDVDGQWTVEVSIVDEAVMRVDLDVGVVR